MIFDLFIRLPRLAMVISILISLAGLIALRVIPLAQYPDIAPPTVQVTATYTGADTLTVEQSVAQPIESAVNGVDGMRYMKSTSASDGSYSLTVSFALGTNGDINAVNVQNRAALATPSLPEEVRRIGLQVNKVSPDVLQVFIFHSPDKRYDQLFLSNYVTLSVLDELARVPGVGRASIFGAQDYAMRIWMDPQKLTNLDLTADDVIAAIQQQNLQAAAGRIGAAPLMADQQLQLTVTTKGRLTSAEEFSNIVLRARSDGAFVRLSDVAQVELGAATFDSLTRYQGGPAAAVGIYLSPGSNAVDVADAVSKRLEELKSRFPPGLDYAYIFNTADFVKAMIEKVIHTLIEAFVLVAIVVFLFLGRLRATLIPLIAVPVAIVGALAVMFALGYTANTISLLALVLAIGIVVDDAIIVVENVERVMEEEPDLTPAQATSKAMSEIAGSVIAITLVLLSVFVPVAFLPGSSGALFREFAVAISAAMVISAINALTLSPALCALILKPGHAKGLMGRISKAINGVTAGYAAIVTRLVRIAIVGVVALIGFGIATGYLFSRVPAGFLPDEDKGFVIVIMNLPPGASLNRTDAAATQAEALIGGDPAVESAVTVLGFDFLAGGTASNAGVMFVRLKDYDERTTPELGAIATATRLSRALAVLPEGQFIAVNPPAISGLGQVGGFEFVLEALQGQDPDDMAQAMRGLVVAANQDPRLAGVFSTFDAETPQVKLDIDRDKAQALGLRISDIFTALQTTLGGYYVNDFNLFGRTWTVRLQAQSQFRSAVSDIYRIYVRNGKGEMVPLSSVAQARLDVGPRTLTRYNNYRAVSINGGPAPGFGAGDAVQAMEAVAARTLPTGYAYEWTGQALEQKQSAGQAPIVMALAVLFAYLFLVALYESWNVPVAVLLTVIVAVLGALGGLWVAGMNFDLYAQIGLVVLIALAAKNAILMNTFSLEMRPKSETVAESAVWGAKLRFRPVMMTSFAFILGLVPLVRASGPGAGSMVAVGVPVISGMLAASLVGIFLIPMVYTVFQGMREWSARKLGRKLEAPL